jgi:hypothetical protein
MKDLDTVLKGDGIEEDFDDSDKDLITLLDGNDNEYIFLRKRYNKDPLLF